MTKPPNAPDHQQLGSSDPVSHLLGGIEPLVRGGVRPGRRSRRRRRNRAVGWVTIALIALMAALTLISVALMVWGS